MKVKDLINLLAMCNPEKEIEIINDDYEDILVLYPFDIDENETKVDILTANIPVDKGCF